MLCCSKNWLILAATIGPIPSTPSSSSREQFINGSNAVVLRGGSGASFTGCTFRDNTLAVRSTTSTGLTITGCTIEDTMSLNGADDSVIESNDVDTGALVLASSQRCSVAKNNFSNCNGRAVQLSSSSDNNVTENTFFKNKEGVRVNPGSLRNMIIRNEFVDNTDAPIYIFSADGNYIYHNNIYGTFLFTSVDEGINFWNNSNDEGNYCPLTRA